MNVLLFEPLMNLRVILRGVLHGYNVTELHLPATALEAMQILSANKIDLFICSDKVKPLTGEKCIQLVRQAREEHIRYIRTMVTTHTTNISEIKNLLAAGTDEILVVPYSIDDANARLHRVISNRARFIETITYTGPDRRRRSLDTFDSEKRSHDNFQKPVFFNASLRSLLLEEIKAQAVLQKKRAEKAAKLADGIAIRIKELKPDMVLASPIKTNAGALISPAGSILTEKFILKVIDLVSTDRVQDEFFVDN